MSQAVSLVCECSLCERVVPMVCVFEEAITPWPKQYGLCVDCTMLIDESLGKFYEMRPMTQYILDAAFKPSGEMRGGCEIEGRYSFCRCQVLVFGDKMKQPKSVCVKCLRGKKAQKEGLMDMQLYEPRAVTRKRILRQFGHLATGNTDGLKMMWYPAINPPIEPASRWVPYRKKALERGPVAALADDNAPIEDPMYLVNFTYISRNIIKHLHEGSYCYVNLKYPEWLEEYSIKNWSVKIKRVEEDPGDGLGRVYRGTVAEENLPEDYRWSGPYKNGDRVVFRPRHICHVRCNSYENEDLKGLLEYVPRPKE